MWNIKVLHKSLFVTRMKYITSRNKNETHFYPIYKDILIFPWNWLPYDSIYLQGCTLNGINRYCLLDRSRQQSINEWWAWILALPLTRSYPFNNKDIWASVRRGDPLNVLVSGGRLSGPAAELRTPASQQWSIAFLVILSPILTSKLMMSEHRDNFPAGGDIFPVYAGSITQASCPCSGHTRGIIENHSTCNLSL